MHFVSCVSIPDDEFAVLGSRNKVSPVSGPMHCVDFCQMTLQDSLGLHRETGQTSNIVFLRDLANCGEPGDGVSISARRE